MAQIIGADDLSEADQKYLKFGDEFENKFVKQDYYENREIEETLDLAWDLLKILPENELDRLSPEMIKQHMNR